ncbi:hypothetical protein DXT91_28255 [Agrobacterium tumefaciens]|uniref:hypothetical protein n=1 Tax=Agrobacterium tumefaciens TaxID=358 RepID=UPI0012B9F1AC|nr:hypothetical protein [Agrobacterium tumefaciens]MQB07932.1 hypothetical protein [Agrobacterium tumefaciens]
MRQETFIKSAKLCVTEVLDDRTAIYAVSAQTCFEKFQAGANRLAGLLVLLEITKSRHVLDMAVQNAAAELIRAGLSELRSLRSTPRSQHFHRHLSKAGELLKQTVEEVDRTLGKSALARDPLAPLKAAWDHLRSASRCLPGFEVIDFSHSCCAHHQTTVN